MNKVICSCQAQVRTSPEVRSYREHALEYENGIADVLSSMLLGDAIVERQVRVPSRRARTGLRSIEILARGQFFGMPEATLAVDCKCRQRNLQVGEVANFMELVDDIGADFGLMVITGNASDLAKARARSVRGIRIATIPLLDLLHWRAAGTICQNVRFESLRDADRATDALRRAGMRVIVWPDLGNGVTCLEVYRHYGKNWPEQVDWERHSRTIGQILRLRRVEYQLCVSSLICGDTVQSIDVEVDGRPTRYGISAKSEQEAAEGLQSLAEHINVPTHRLAIVRPDGWPDAWPFGPLLPIV